MQSTQWVLLSDRQFSPQQCFGNHSSFSLWLCHFKCVAKASMLVSTEDCASEGFLGPVLPGSCAPTLCWHTASFREARQRGGFVIPGGAADWAGPVGHAVERRRYSSSTCDTSIIMSKPTCLNLIHHPLQKAASPPSLCCSFQRFHSRLPCPFPRSVICRLSFCLPGLYCFSATCPARPFD